MKTPLLVMGIDFGTSGARVAVLNESNELIHTSEMPYRKGLSICKDWEQCTIELIRKIPIHFKQFLRACAIDGTSGTIVACDTNGVALGPALPYHTSCPEEQNSLAEILPQGGIASTTDSSLARALCLQKEYQRPHFLRHQADWVTGWLLDDWQWGEEGNNLRMGWDPQTKLWPAKLYEPSWQKSLPVIVQSGTILKSLSPKKAEQLGLPKNLVVIAGTTDSNAAVLSANPEPDDGLTVLGSTIVVKRFVDKPLVGYGVTNHRLLNRWLCGGASNSGGTILKRLFSDKTIQELSQQINPELDSGLRLRPMPFKGERFPVNDPKLEPIMTPRPVSDCLYLHGILEGLARIEKQGWQKLIALGAPAPKRIITIGGGAKNPQWRRIRERMTGYPIKTCKSSPAEGVARLALKAIRKINQSNTIP